MPATTKEGALEEKIQLAEGAGFSRQKRLTLRAGLRYLKNSDHCIKWTNCSSLHAWSSPKKLGQSLWNLTFKELSKSSVFAAKNPLPLPVVFFPPMPLLWYCFYTKQYQRRGIGGKKPLQRPGFILIFCHFHIENKVILKFL